MLKNPKLQQIVTLARELDIDTIEPAVAPISYFKVSGKISTFGGPRDTGVSLSEGLAIWDSKNDPMAIEYGLFLKGGEGGLARSLDPTKFYIAMRWDYSKTPKSRLKHMRVICRANGLEAKAIPADWGPAQWTKRVADLSPGLAEKLGLSTDQSAEFELIE